MTHCARNIRSFASSAYENAVSYLLLTFHTIVLVLLLNASNEIYGAFLQGSNVGVAE